MMEHKKTLSSLNDIRSHPHKSLFIHLRNVGEKSKEILETKNLKIERFIDFEILKKISFLIGVAHDFGKATKFFQEYINEENDIERRRLGSKKETHHAFISSLFAYYVVKEELLKQRIIENEY